MGVYYGQNIKNLSISYQTTSNITATQSSFTHSNVTLGSESRLRRILIATGTSAVTTPITINSATIAGVTADILLQQTGTLVGSGYAHTAFLSALVPTGTTGNIVVNYAANVLRNYIAVYNLSNWNGTLFSSGSATTYSGSSLTVSSLSVPNYGVIIGNAIEAGQGSSFTWNLTTEDYDDAPVANRIHSGARQSYINATSGITVTATTTATGGAGCMTAIGIGPIR